MTAAIIPTLIILALIALNGLFVAAEFAIIAAPRTRLQRLAEEGSAIAARVLAILDDPEKQNLFITTAQVGITIASLGLGMYGENVMAEWLAEKLIHAGRFTDTVSHSIATVSAVGALTYLHVVLGEMIPKSLALQSSVGTVTRLAGVMRVLEKVFSPIVWILNQASLIVTRWLGFDLLTSSKRFFSAAELEYVVAKSESEGLIELSDKVIVENILDLKERTLEQVMTPRMRLVGIGINTSYPDAYHFICETTKTRYPVFEGNIDSIKGILHIKDILRWRSEHEKGEPDLKMLLRETLYLPESMQVLEGLRRMRRENIQMAIVLDEFGGTAGVVTLEDMIEEVVGEIQDEFDSEEVNPIQVLAPGRLRVRGDVILDELNQHYELNLEHEEANTIGGLVMALLGSIPQGGEVVEHGGIAVKVLGVEEHAVSQVLVTLLTAED
ncbi:MAG: hemolysin family protein [Anaerolineae bacterium]|nr:hemolysin family protein [Anaerolineae bacterium]